MNKTILLIFACLLFSNNVVIAQVTIGSIEAPEKFSALELDGVTGGFRLPQLTTAQRDILDVSSTKGVGLVIYNIETSTIEKWNGSTWLLTEYKLQLANGLTESSKIGILGGSFTKDIEIDINGKQLEFVTGTIGKFSINSDVFSIQYRAFSAKANNYTVNTDALKVSGDNSVTLNGSLETKVNNDKIVADTDVKIAGQMAYTDGNEGAGKVLLSNDVGKAFWGVLKPSTEIKSSGILGAGTVITTAYGNPGVIISSGDILLRKGKWLIFAKCSAKTAKTAVVYLAWLTLNSRNATAPLETLENGVAMNVDYDGFTTPELVYFMDVKEETKSIYLRAGITEAASLYEGGIANSSMGPSYFFAILIDEPQ